MPNKNNVIFQDLGMINYKMAWDFQEELFKKSIQMKLDHSHSEMNVVNKVPNYLLFCEHPHVMTLGKSGSENNLLINEDILEKRGVEFFRINRGGDITYHGPGQIVGYPIIDMEQFGLGVRKYIEILEQAVINTLDHYGIKAGRLSEAIGVWLDPDNPLKARKICAIGVRTSRHVTMHGFAFNVNTNLSYYNLINPCGFADKGVTSMEKELGIKLELDEVKAILKKAILDILSGL